jgi:hypothetical protein
MSVKALRFQVLINAVIGHLGPNTKMSGYPTYQASGLFPCRPQSRFATSGHERERLITSMSVCPNKMKLD